MKILQIFKETFLTLLSTSFFIGAFLGVAAWFHWSIPAPHQRPVFMVGGVLFALVFRVWMIGKEKNS